MSFIEDIFVYMIIKQRVLLAIWEYRKRRRTDLPQLSNVQLPPPSFDVGGFVVHLLGVAFNVSPSLDNHGNDSRVKSMPSRKITVDDIDNVACASLLMEISFAYYVAKDDWTRQKRSRAMRLIDQCQRKHGTNNTLVLCWNCTKQFIYNIYNFTLIVSSC